MSDFQKDSNARYRDLRDWLLGPILPNNRWSVFWAGWIIAAYARRWIDQLHLEIYGLIGLFVVYILNRGKWPQRPQWPQRPTEHPSDFSEQIERTPAQPRSRLWYVLNRISLWLVMALVFLLIFNYFAPSNGTSSRQEPPEPELTYSDFLNLVEHDEIAHVTIQGNWIHSSSISGEHSRIYAPHDPDLIKRLREKNVMILAKPEAGDP